MQITAVRKVEPKLSRCISVESDDRLYVAGDGGELPEFVTHNSVSQRNIILGCILRPDHWRFIGIDLKRVELSSYRSYSNVVLGIATELETALMALRFASETMMSRYTMMEEMGQQDFKDLPNAGPKLLVMVDEAGELLSPSGGKTDEAKEIDALKGEAAIIIGSIARLGRAAGVHLVIATQRPDATIIAGETKSNLAARVNCGRTLGNASSMILDSAEGTRVKPFPPGRMYVSLNNVGDHGQGFFAKPSWVDDYLESKGLAPDGTPLDGSGKAAGGDGGDLGELDINKSTKKQKVDAIADWDEDLESLIDENFEDDE